MDIHIVPVKALKDNYIWVLINNKTNHALVVDPGEAKPVIHYLETNNLILSAILITHKHWDHCNGIEELIEKYKVPVLGPVTAAINAIDFPLTEGDQPLIPHFEKYFTVLSIPGHTLEHIAYYGGGILFCGDTLFTGGCGRVFEGTMQQMQMTLSRLANLPANTLIYCGHEYTAANLQFALTVEPNNQHLLLRIAETKKLVSAGIPTVPSTLELEKKTNPFLRCHQADIIRAVSEQFQLKLTSPVDVFTYLRKWKDSFVS